MIKDLSVLYVEDDEIVRENFSQILERYFSSVYVTDNGKTALELYDRYKPDIAVLDISIPQISGLEVASKIRERDAEIQIIMLTAYADQEKLLKAVNLQLFAYLIKPVQQLQLDETLRAVQQKFLKDDDLKIAYGYRWDKGEQSLFLNDKPIRLTSNEHLIVALMCKSPNRYFTACQIAQEIMEDYDSSDFECNNIVQIISRFKKKVLKNYNTDLFFIQNTYGSGYKIDLAGSAQ